MNVKTLIAGAAFLLAGGLPCCWASKAMLTVKIVDESGQPIGGTHLVVGFWNMDRTLTEVKGVAGTNGSFVAEGREGCGDAGYHVMGNSGYYESEMTYAFTNLDRGRWQPWNPVVTAVVRRIVNPIPMYARKVEVRIPRTNEWFGYDLMAADWVQPVGKGLVSDLIFSITGVRKDPRNYDETLALRFSRPNDGIVPVRYDVVN